MPVAQKTMQHQMTGLEQVYLEVSPVWTCHGQSHTPRPRPALVSSVASVDQWTSYGMGAVAYFIRLVSFYCVNITETMYLFEPTWMILWIVNSPLYLFIIFWVLWAYSEVSTLQCSGVVVVQCSEHSAVEWVQCSGVVVVQCSEYSTV